MSPTVIHVSPHPDDESIAAPCALLMLRAAGWTVINYAVSLGRPADRSRRRDELGRALAVAGFTHREAFASMSEARRPGISRPDDLRRACRELTRDLRQVVLATDASLVVGPHPRDRHHGHATVSRAIRQVVWESETPLPWWMWGVWADLPRPTVVVPCSERNRKRSGDMLAEYSGEIERNDYHRMQEPMRIVNAVRGVETVFGYGTSPAADADGVTHAELLTEVTAIERRWMVGRPRVLGGELVPDPPRSRTASRHWVPLDDLSIMSSTRMRPLYNAVAMSVFSRNKTVGKVVGSAVDRWDSLHPKYGRSPESDAQDAAIGSGRSMSSSAMSRNPRER